MSWQKEYQSKLVSLEEAAGYIESGDTAFLSPMHGAPFQLANAIAERSDELMDVDILSGVELYPFKFLQSSDYLGKINYHSLFTGGARAYYKYGNVNCNSVNLSQFTNSVRDVYHVNTLIAEVSPPDENGYMSWGPGGTTTNGDIAEFAKKIIVQVNKHQPMVYGVKTLIHVSQVTCICEEDHEIVSMPDDVLSEQDKIIAKYILEEIPDGATIQLGLGNLTNAVGYGLMSKKNLSIHSEVFTNSMLKLYKAGVVNGNISCSFALGSKELHASITDERIQFMPLSIVNSPANVAKNPNMVAINACMMTDLTGQVCSESIGHYLYSSTGGQLDFVSGSWLAEGGINIMCLNSVNQKKDGTIVSNIMLNLPPGAAVTTPRSMVMNIVTEYGIARLKNRSIRERVSAMISIAHPDFREELRKDAVKAGLLPE